MASEEDKLRRVFDIYCVTPCTDCVHFINLNNMFRLLKDIGHANKVLASAGMHNIKVFFHMIDLNGDGKITYDEFFEWWFSTKRQRYCYFSDPVRSYLEKAWEIFCRFSIGHSIPYRKFSALMSYLKVTYSDVDFDYIDINSDGSICFSEFCEWLGWF